MASLELLQKGVHFELILVQSWVTCPSADVIFGVIPDVDFIQYMYNYIALLPKFKSAYDKTSDGSEDFLLEVEIPV